MKVHYIGYYINENDENRYKGNVPGRLKMRYIRKALNRAGFSVSIFSLCTSNENAVFSRSKTEDLDQNDIIQYVASFPSETKIFKILNAMLVQLQLVYYLLVKVKETETVVMYHSYFSTRILSLLKKLRKLKIIIQIEEIYGYSADGDKSYVNREVNLLRNFEKYIVVNDMIPKKLGLKNSDYAVCYGVYELPTQEHYRFLDGCIHVVYAGTIELRKLGALAAVKAAKYLPENYKMHILGFGRQKAIDTLKEQINQVNLSVNNKIVEYHGMLKGLELSKFLNGCHIGLSSYTTRESYANNTCPSKLITYMCHGLEVVVGYAKWFEGVRISRDWNFYYNDNPEAIARAIKETKIREDKSENIKFIAQLDMNLTMWLRQNIHNL